MDNEIKEEKVDTKKKRSGFFTLINVYNGTTIRSHKNTMCSKVTKITYASSTRVIMQGEGQMEYDLSTGVMYG